MAETLNKCGDCGAEFFYALSSHRCPGEWEAISGDAVTDPFEGLSWSEECLAKVRAS